jgi:hypothetical protein
MQKYPGCRIPYVALTRKSAEGIVWKALEELNHELGLGLAPKIGNLKMVAPNGSEIFLVGANKAGEINKLRGIKTPLVGIDEAASFRPSLLEYLIDDVISPSLMDYAGTLILVGTPSAQPVGYFYDVTTGKEPGWSVFRWDSRDNPHIPHASQWLKELRERKGWDENHPTYRREYLGEWIRDNDALVYKLRDDNIIGEMPGDYEPGAPHWAHVIGIDYGYVDSTAFVVWAFRSGNTREQTTYCVHASKTVGHLPSEAASYTRKLVDQYKPQRVYGDAGGLGKPYIEEARRRFAIQVHPAEKSEKLAHIELFNDDLRRGRSVFLESACRDYIEEMQMLPWDMDRVTVNVAGRVRHEDRKREDPRYENHLCDAGLYGNRGCTAYWNEIRTKDARLARGEDLDDGEGLTRKNESRYLQGLREQKKRWWDKWGTGNRWH